MNWIGRFIINQVLSRLISAIASAIAWYFRKKEIKKEAQAREDRVRNAKTEDEKKAAVEDLARNSF